MTDLTIRSSVAATAAALVLGACGSSETDRTPARASVRAPAGATAPVIEDCSTRSEAGFPAAFSHPDNVVVGPLVLVGAAHTPAGTVREFGGDKIPALVKPGHRVTVTVLPRARRLASLGYGPLPEGVELTARDGHPAVTFISCRPGEPSGSTAGAQPVTFWSGFVLTSAPGCVPLEVRVDDEPAARRATVRMGVRRCR
jgi:hypothetical protein